MATEVVQDSKQVQVRVGENLREGLNVVAYECSSPSEKVDRSDVIRAAFRDYYRKHRSNLEDCDPWERGEPGEQPRKQMSVKFLETELQRVDEVAHDCSGPNRSVSRSDVIRAACRDYVDKYEGDVRECQPLTGGGLLGPSGSGS